MAPVSSSILPVYNALGGPLGKDHVTFDRAQSQYLHAGARTLKIATNGYNRLLSATSLQSYSTTSTRMET